jgi:transcriptional regulator with XRE-family HTH domain
MATAEFELTGSMLTPVVTNNEVSDEQRLHRIRTVRLQQGVSLRSAARHIGTDVRSLRRQEQESTDLRISDLHKWQKALDVPLMELVEDTDEPLSRPVMERARLIRLMKTAAAIHERSPSEALKRMAETMVNQLVEIMPELKEVSPWHTYGQRRSLDEYGRVAERCVSDEFLDGGDCE